MTFREHGSWWRHQRRHFLGKRNFLCRVRCNSAPSTHHYITPKSPEDSFYDFQRTRKLLTSSAPPLKGKTNFLCRVWCNSSTSKNHSITPKCSEASFHDFQRTQRWDGVIIPGVGTFQKSGSTKILYPLSEHSVVLPARGDWLSSYLYLGLIAHRRH